MKNKVIVSIGSNINPDLHIAKGLELISDYINIANTTPLKITSPIGITNQEPFTNGALIGETEWSIEELTTKLKEVEDKVGRIRTRPKFGPREIDFDIIMWNDEIVDEDYYSRDFLKEMVDWLMCQDKNM